jgi:hypothetical protein
MPHTPAPLDKLLEGEMSKDEITSEDFPRGIALFNGRPIEITNIDLLRDRDFLRSKGIPITREEFPRAASIVVAARNFGFPKDIQGYTEGD